MISQVIKTFSQRTNRQNKAIYKYFERLADELNSAGYEMKAVLAIKQVDIPWSKDTVKECLWKPIQEAMLNKSSTAKLTTDEVNKVYEVLNRHIGQNFGVFVDFPHDEGAEHEDHQRVIK